MIHKNLLRFYSTTRKQQKVGFLGLGNMGISMSKNLVKKGFTVNGFDLNQDSLIKAEQNGVFVASSVAEAVKNVDYVVTCLPKTNDVEKILTDPTQGVFKFANKGTMILDTSTISPVAAKQLSIQADKNEMTFCDTPMAGGTGGAASGQLTFMVGAKNESDFEKASNVLNAMGKTIVHCGQPGDGEVAKLVNNLILGIMMVASSEGIALGEKLGIDAKTLHRVLTASSSNNWCLNNYNPYPGLVESSPASKDYAGGFQVGLIRKDLALAIDSADQVGASSNVTQQCMEIFEKLEQNGQGNKDFGVVFQHILKDQGNKNEDFTVSDIKNSDYKKYN